MKAEIFYFSGTGNSLEIARGLAAELGESCLTSIPKALAAPMRSPAERIGIVFPVYMFGMPRIVREFIRRLNGSPAQYVFAVVTYGGAKGIALEQCGAELKKRGLRLSAGFGVLMPGNYTPLYGALPQERQQKIFEAARARLKEIASVIREGKRDVVEKGFLLLRPLFGFVSWGGMLQVPASDRKFWVDEKCNGCGVCEKVCPVFNIKLASGKPSWLRHCQACMACLQWCPAEAIQYGKNTPGRKRYRHPACTWEDFRNDR